MIIAAKKEEMTNKTPQAIGIEVMARLRELGEPPTPENYEAHYYSLSGLPRPEKVSSPDDPERADAKKNEELARILREMLEEITLKAESLAGQLGERNGELKQTVGQLSQSRDKTEILRLLGTIMTQTGMIQNTVQSGYEEFQEVRDDMHVMREELQETRKMLLEDPLTGAQNRRGMEQTLEREVSRSHRAKARLAAIMVDLDFFKNVNDSYGHDAGDKLLLHLSTLMKSVLRDSDILARYGGEEFVLVLPDTEVRGASLVITRLQTLFTKNPMEYQEHSITCTFSAGIAQLKDDENAHALLTRADKALYDAKHAGRNCFKIAP
jgi:diguanylate cyclase